MDEKDGTSTPKREEETSQPRKSQEAADPEKTSLESQTGFEPIRPPRQGDNDRRRRGSVDTLSTIRRERSNNGWGVDDLEEGPDGEIVAPYNHHPNPEEAHDPFEVGWDNGDNDALCPRSLPTWRKWVIIGIASVGSFSV